MSKYDFRRPIQLSREHSRLLQLALDSFSRQATTLFTSSLRTVCSISLVGIEQQSYAEYVDSLDARTYMTVFSAEPVSGKAVLEFPLVSVMACVDHMLGGPGTAAQPERPLTEIETGVMDRLTERVLHELQYSLSETIPIEPEIVTVEYSPQFAQVAAASDVMVVSRFAVEIGERSYTSTLCLPFSGIRPFLTAAAAPAPVSERERAKRIQSAELLRGQLDFVPIEVVARLRTTRVSPQTLSAMEPGSILRLTHPADAPLEIVADKTVLAHATAGNKGQRLAAMIVATPKETR